MLQPGAIIGGRFRVDRMLGAGGMGVVVAATHLELGQQVALKVLHEELATNPNIVARFLREARAVAQLRTDHVCRVFDVGRLDSGAPFIVMEMLDGTDLASVVQRGPVAVTTAVEYIIQACVALAEAHAAGVVHRDLKPGNLFVVRRPDGGPHVKVLDFGIAKAATAAEAKLTHTTSTMGSPGYMSPEQIRSARDVDLRTDIWALGVTLFQLLAGRLPFGGTQLAEIAVNITTAPPQPLEVDPALRAVVLRCLEKEPERRFPDVQSLAVALMPFGGPSAPRFVRELTRGAAGGPEPAPPPPRVDITAPTAPSMIGHAAPTTPQPPASSSTKWYVIGGLAVVALVAIGAVGGYLARDDDKPAPPVAVADAGAPVADPVATPTDAAAAGSGDQWDTQAIVPGLAETDRVEADKTATEKVVTDAYKNAKAQIPESQRTMIRQQLRAAEAQLDKYKDVVGAQYEDMLAGYVTAACMVDDADLAKRMYARIQKPDLKLRAREACTHFGYALK